MKKIHLLLLLTFISKVFLSWFLELGNDEVYYYTYLQKPDWAHFDHPGLFALLALAFTFNLSFDHEIFLRLSSIVFSTATVYILYRIGKEWKDEKLGFYLALSFSVSIYGGIICGFFLMPDAVLMFFWSLTLWMFFKWLQTPKITFWYACMVALAFALWSKYQAALLGFGIGIFILLRRKNFLKSLHLYLGALIAALGFVPTLIWNLQNKAQSFDYHSSRIKISFENLGFEYFFPEFFGEIFYFNPLLYGILIWGWVVLLKRLKKEKHLSDKVFALITIGLPLWLVALFFSLFGRTLPHWAIPGIFTLFIAAVCSLVDQVKLKKILIYSTLFFGVILVYGALEIQNGWIMNQKTAQQEDDEKGKHDFTQDLYGWEQLAQKFGKIKSKNIHHLIIYKWFPGGHLNYYLARPYHYQLLPMGSAHDLHKFVEFQPKENFPKTAYLILQSNQFKPIEEILPKDAHYKLVATIPIARRKQIIRYHWVYEVRLLD